MLLSGWRRALLAFLAGLVATLALAPFNIPAVGFLSFPVLVWLIDGASGEPGRSALRRAFPAFRIGWCFGFGYFVGGLWWLGSALLVDGPEFAWALPFAVLGLPAILAIYHGLGCMLARLAWSGGPWRLLALAAGLSGAEFARGMLFTGFSWNEIGVMAVPVPLLMQVLTLFGLHAMTLLAVFVFSLPAIVVGRRGGRSAAVALGLALVAAQLAFGAWRLAAPPAPPVEGVALRIVQPNVLQGQKWDPAEAERIFSRLLELTDAPAADSTPAAPRRLVIWPESSFPFILTDRPDAVGALAQTLRPGDTLLAGATRVEEGTGEPPRFYNSIYAIGEDGVVEDAADKIHLVPFGEYLPFQALLESWGVSQVTKLPGGFSAGARRRIVELEGVPGFLPVICYEAIFQDELVPFPEGERPGFILNVTNDAWYGLTPGPYQHQRQAVLTAVSLGLPLVRAANTGISVVTDAEGRPQAGLALGEGGTVDAALPGAGRETVFAQLRNIPFGILWGLAAATALLAARRRSREGA
ncbi:apolipoprotein N-acyltransferase [Aureimonas sp. AU4]|uniref:apolipoprotein N-acyltransferase n=1 Tax=Aureimonas sp. AU4 TaxID=1638163 RepID=UPI000785988B|nr:apolipoprotein N-acyltransferase [Aureimonas sp. AU4]